MKKKNLPYYIFLLLIVITVVLIFSNRQGTLDRNSHNFAPDDITGVYKVEISQKGDTLVIEKSGGEWILNKNVPARKELVDLFIATLQRVEAVSPAAKIVRKKIVSSLLSSGKKVQIYASGHRTLTYFVLFDSTDIRGTYMMKEHAHMPFLVRLNGYQGANIEQLYSIDEKTWRQNIVFHFRPSEISSVRVDYPSNMGNSFEIHQTKMNCFELSGYHRIIPEDRINSRNIGDYLYYFGNVRYSYPEKPGQVMITDKLPFAVVTIIDMQKRITKLKAIRKPPAAKSLDKYDMDRFYGIVQSDTVIMNYRDIDPILRHLDDFQKK